MSGTLYAAGGEALRLGARIGRGGEGSVFAISDGRVAKLYANANAPALGAKLQALIGLDLAPVRNAAAWPEALVYDERGTVAGFLMPRLEGFAPIASAANPAARKQAFPQAGWAWLAHVSRNLAVAVQTLHDAGIVAGDLNESNVLVASDARVRFIDVDSFQVPDGNVLLACNVGTPMYQPPELQGRPFAGLARTPNHDRFGLAVLIFQLLFMGRHPWAGKWSGGELSFENGEYIARLPFAYGVDARRVGFEPPEDAVSMDWFPATNATLFERAFAKGSREARPSGTEWVAALDDLQRSLVRCKSVPTHQHPGSMSPCPWCVFDRAGFLFFIVGSPGVARQSLDIAAVEASLRAIPAQSDLAPALTPANVAVVGEPVDPRLVRHTRMWYAEIAGSSVATFAAAHWLALAFALAATIALVALIVLTRPPLRPVRAARRERLSGAERRYVDALRTRDYIVNAAHIEARKRELSDMLARYKALPAKYQAERQALERDRYRLQLEAFLDQVLVRDAAPWRIGRKTRATLAAFGIETARDVALRLPSADIPGIGSRKRERLAAWVAGHERKFRFDPRRPLDRSVLDALARREQEERSMLERHLRGGPQALLRDAETLQKTLAEARGGLEEAARALAQAQADWAMAQWL